ncbi:properdin-like [Clytia hemisphaerica]|uniref:properdin-like n=1 Tax=Clytia hemisphaerica TaxID=252671 RepID=UPI0034D577E4
MCNCKSPGDLTYGPWTSWGSCNKDCGYGTKSRYRTCLNESKECEVDETQQQKNCNEFACPVDGNWGSWSQWSICSVTCGGGKRSRVRYCTNPTPVNGGRNCLGISEISEKCGDDQICPIHGGYDDWSTWSPCTPTCGQNRTRSRRRECDKPFPSLGGSDCIGPSRIEEQCSNASCMPVNIEGEMAICDDAYNLDTNDTITMKNHNLFMEIENRLQESINNFYSNLADEFKPKIVLHSIVRPTGKLSDVCKKSKKTD